MESIDPTNLTPRQKSLLGLLFKQSEGEINVFEAGVPYKVTLRPARNGATGTVEIKLTHTVYERPSKNKSKKPRHDIINEDPEHPFNTGGTSLVYRVLGTLKPEHRHGISFETSKNRLCKATHRTIKTERQDFTQKVTDSVYNEIELANLAGSGHMKYPAWIEYDSKDKKDNDIVIRKAYITMRERKGKELLTIVNQERSREPVKLTTQQRLDLSLSLLYAMKTLHDKGIIHRDIKLENVFYDPKKNKSKFIDFGCAKFLQNMDNEGKGTHGYIPPEFFFGEKADQKSDLYSIGILLSILWGGKDQAKDADNNDLEPYVFHEPDFTTLFRCAPTDFSPLEEAQFRDFIKKITEINRDDRISVEEAISALETFTELYKKNRVVSSKRDLFHLFKRKEAKNDTTIEETKETMPRKSV